MLLNSHVRHPLFFQVSSLCDGVARVTRSSEMHGSVGKSARLKVEVDRM